MIERGERIPHVETLAALARALDVTLSDLFSGTNREPTDAGELLRPLSEFVRSRNLTASDIEKLLGVARALFTPPAQ